MVEQIRTLPGQADHTGPDLLCSTVFHF